MLLKSYSRDKSQKWSYGLLEFVANAILPAKIFSVTIEWCCWRWTFCCSLSLIVSLLLHRKYFSGWFHQHFTSSFYARRSQSPKRYCLLDWFFMLFGSARVKAACKMSIEIALIVPCTAFSGTPTSGLSEKTLLATRRSRPTWAKAVFTFLCSHTPKHKNRNLRNPLVVFKRNYTSKLHKTWIWRTPLDFSRTHVWEPLG